MLRLCYGGVCDGVFLYDDSKVVIIAITIIILSQYVSRLINRLTQYKACVRYDDVLQMQSIIIPVCGLISFTAYNCK